MPHGGVCFLFGLNYFLGGHSCNGMMLVCVPGGKLIPHRERERVCLGLSRIGPQLWHFHFIQVSIWQLCCYLDGVACAECLGQEGLVDLMILYLTCCFSLLVSVLGSVGFR